MAEPTPGPWTVGWGGGVSGRRAAALPYLDGTPVVYVPIRHDKQLVCIVPVVTCGSVGLDELMPDARLIAKARHLPALVEALADLVEACNRAAKVNNRPPPAAVQHQLRISRAALALVQETE